jgi:hypothetical protein
VRSARLLDSLFGIDGRSLATFRIGVGALVLLDLWTRASAIEQHYSDLGVLPRDAYARLLAVSDWQWSIHFLTGSVVGQSILFLIAAVAACALTAGYRTRLAAVVTWFMLVSLQARNPMVLYGADQLLRLLLFWSMFLPLGCTWSIDRWRATFPSPATTRHLSMASGALLLQPCVMYFVAGLLKLNPSWQSGSALTHALSADMYVTPFGRMLSGYLPFLAVLSQAVPWIELLAVVPLLMPWRTTAFRIAGLLLLTAFHLGVSAVLSTGLFPATAFVALVPFIPAQVWDRLAVGLRSFVGPPVARGRLSSQPARRANPRGISTATQLLVAALFAYGLVWNVVGLRLEEYTAQQSLNWARQWWSEGRTGVPLSFRDYTVERMMGGFGWIGRVSALHQRWDMFSRVGPQISGWPVIIGTLTDGRKMNLLDGDTPSGPVSHLLPAAPLTSYKGTRWRVYFTGLRGSGLQAARELLPAVVTRDWERQNPGLKLESLRILFAKPANASGGSPPVKNEVWYDGPPTGPSTGA